jgi:hypothetical protein
MDEESLDRAIAPESVGNIIHVEEPVKNEESDLRKAIQKIQADETLDSSAKAKKMQVFIVIKIQDLLL